MVLISATGHEAEETKKANKAAVSPAAHIQHHLRMRGLLALTEKRNML